MFWTRVGCHGLYRTWEVQEQRSDFLVSRPLSEWNPSWVVSLERRLIYFYCRVQDYVPENLDTVAGFEPPQSPASSYNDTFPTPQDFSKEPPSLPSHLHLTLLNVPLLEETTSSLPRPQHVTLNHLYVEKGKNLRSVVALGLTHRYRSKYVTVALYKPVHR